MDVRGKPRRQLAADPVGVPPAGELEVGSEAAQAHAEVADRLGAVGEQRLVDSNAVHVAGVDPGGVRA